MKVLAFYKYCFPGKKNLCFSKLTIHTPWVKNPCAPLRVETTHLWVEILHNWVEISLPLSWNFAPLSWNSVPLRWYFPHLSWNFAPLSWNFAHLSWKQFSIHELNLNFFELKLRNFRFETPAWNSAILPWFKLWNSEIKLGTSPPPRATPLPPFGALKLLLKRRMAIPAPLDR